MKLYRTDTSDSLRLAAMSLRRRSDKQKDFLASKVGPASCIVDSIRLRQEFDIFSFFFPMSLLFCRFDIGTTSAPISLLFYLLVASSSVSHFIVKMSPRCCYDCCIFIRLTLRQTYDGACREELQNVPSRKSTRKQNYENPMKRG